MLVSMISEDTLNLLRWYFSSRPFFQQVSRFLLNQTTQALTVGLGVIAALIVPPLIRHLPNHFIFLLSMVAFIACNIIAATASASTENGEYWKGTFWSLIIGTFGPGMYILRLSFVPWAKAKVKRCSFYYRLEF